MDKLNTFTSTGFKLLRQGNLLSKWNKGTPSPQSLQVALTEKCTLKCEFCSVANRDNLYEFNFCDLLKATDSFIKLGIKTVEITGGGDPLLYPNLNEYLNYLFENNLEVGIITNGIGVNKRISAINQSKLAWIRVSSNVLDYRPTIELPHSLNGTLGFSYCWTEGISSKDQLIKIKKIALDNNVKYVRLVPNCLSDDIELKRQQDMLSSLAEELGEPLFYQPKNFSTPDKCYFGYVKPFLYCDGYIYPCSSTVLNDSADKKFNSIYRWYHYEEVDKIYSKEIVSAVDIKNCNHCVFCDQNNMLDYALTSQTHENFI